MNVDFINKSTNQQINKKPRLPARLYNNLKHFFLNALLLNSLLLKFGRDERIRTSDPLHPMQMR